MEYREYWLYLAGIGGMESGRRRMLLEMFGTPEEIYRADEKLLRKCPMLEEKHIGQILEKRNVDWESEAEKISGSGIGFVTCEDESFPERLRNIPDAPLFLFFMGKLPENVEPTVAVIGSRRCSFYGREICTSLTAELASCGISITSGMAMGIDGFAHRGAIAAGGKTYAVVGSGPDLCYPAQNRDIYLKLAEKNGSFGGVISEYYPGTPPLPLNFPQRNRIISGLADILLVIEARKHSGTSITVGHALEQGREVFAVPGRLGDIMSDGCNLLIKNGAHLITEAADIIEELKNQYEILLKEEIRKRKRIPQKLNPEEKRVLNLLSLHPVRINEISEKTGLGMGEVSRILVGLELENLAQEVGKNTYIKISQ